MKLILLTLWSTVFLTTVTLEKRLLLNDRIEMLIPKDFKEMDDAMLNLKYPKTGNRPTFVLTDDDASVNIAFNHLPNPANSSSIEGYKNSIKASYKNSFPTASWKGDGISAINGKKVGFLKLITEAKDQRVYNYLFLTDLDGRLLIGTFNCTEKQVTTWEKIAEEIIASIKVR